MCFYVPHSRPSFSNRIGGPFREKNFYRTLKLPYTAAATFVDSVSLGFRVPPDPIGRRTRFRARDVESYADRERFPVRDTVLFSDPRIRPKTNIRSNPPLPSPPLPTSPRTRELGGAAGSRGSIGPLVNTLVAVRLSRLHTSTGPWPHRFFFGFFFLSVGFAIIIDCFTNGVQQFSARSESHALSNYKKKRIGFGA